MEHLSQLAGPGRRFLAIAALCAAGTGVAADKHAISIGATVIVSNQCRITAATGMQCARAIASPAIAANPPAPSASYDGNLVVKLSAAGASLDSRNTAASDPVVLTIAP